MMVSTSWSKADIHIHTVYSDGTATVREVLEHTAAHTDLRVIAVTDHDTIEGALEARSLADAYGIEIIVGEEVSTSEGHLLALFIEQPIPPRRSAAATIAAVHAQGGLCIAAHPYDMVVPSLGRYGLQTRAAAPSRDWHFDAIETFNASLWLASNNTRAATVAAALELPACGGSDSHHLATIGLGYTLFPGRNAADLFQAVLCGQTRADGRYWHRIHNLEVVARWMRLLARRAFLRQAPIASRQ